MITNSPFDGGTRSGTLCGMLLVLLVQVSSAELLKTAFLAALGAVVSFAVSLALKWWYRRYRK